jgi:ribosomal-protein-alanine N-acetyltransferase
MFPNPGEPTGVTRTWSIEFPPAEQAAALAALAQSAHFELDVHEELERSYAWLRVARTASGDIAAEDPCAAYLLGWHVADELQLLQLVTRKESRRSGAARALLLAFLDYGRTHQARLVLLEVRRSNVAARDLYASVGFAEHDVRRNYYEDPCEDALVLALEL